MSDWLVVDKDEEEDEKETAGVEEVVVVEVVKIEGERLSED